MTPSRPLRVALPLALLLAPGLAGCSGGESSAGTADATAEAPAPPAVASTATPAPAQAAPAASDAAAAADEGARAASSEASATQLAGRPRTLDTGIDLSHLKGAITAGSAFPEHAPNRAVAQPATDLVPAGPPGKLVIPEGEGSHDFGKVREGEKPRHVFQLEAGGENPLVIQRLKPSCGCTAAEIHVLDGDERSMYTLGGSIPPGTKFEIPVQLDTHGRRGPTRTHVSIYSNDPAGVTRLEVMAEVEPMLTITPPLLDFGRITVTDTAGGEMTVQSPILDPFLLRVDETSLKDPLAIELEPIDPNEEGKSREWRVRFHLGPDLTEGVQGFQVRLVTDSLLPEAQRPVPHPSVPPPPMSEYRSIVANVRAIVTALVVAEPNFISLGLVRPGSPVERTFSVRSLDEGFQLPEEPTVTFADLFEKPLAWGDQFEVEVVPSEERDSYQVTLRLPSPPEGVNGSFGGMVQLGVAHPTKEVLNVRFSGVVRLDPGVGTTAPSAPVGPPAPTGDEGHDHAAGESGAQGHGKKR